MGRLQTPNVPKPNPYGDDKCKPAQKLKAAIGILLCLLALFIIYYFIQNKQSITRSMQNLEEIIISSKSHRLYEKNLVYDFILSIWMSFRAEIVNLMGNPN